MRLLRIFIIILIPVVTSTLVYFLMRYAFVIPADEAKTTKTLFEIKTGANFRDVCNDLKNQGFIRFASAMEVLSRIRKSDRAINAGEYQISPAMTPKEILEELRSGRVFKREVTVTPGASIWDLGKVVEAEGLLSAAEFGKAVADPQLLARAGISAQSFEGYLYPETYQFSRPITAQNIIWKMLEEGEKHWPEEYSQRVEELSLTRHEILTLASVIEKESGKDTELPLISSVFHNRLAQGIKLQSDPTVIYGIHDFSGNLTKEDLQTPHPYNTYTNFGLPPGPICNPGELAVKAALFPAQTTYLFFVADGAGGHVFSTTLQEHNEAVKRYLSGQKDKAAEVPAVVVEPEAVIAPEVVAPAP